jgi:hypothetical protein
LTEADLAGLGPEAIALVLGQESKGQNITQNIINNMMAKQAAETSATAKVQAASTKAIAASNLASNKAIALKNAKEAGFASAKEVAEIRSAKTPEELELMMARAAKLRRETEVVGKEPDDGFKERRVALSERKEEAGTRDYILGDADIESRKLEATIANQDPKGNTIFYHDPGRGGFGVEWESMQSFQIPSGIPAELQPHIKEIIISSAEAAGLDLDQQIKKIKDLNAEELINYLEGI